MISVAAIFTGYTGIQLGENWALMQVCTVLLLWEQLKLMPISLQKRWPEYKEHCRRPYPEMAYRAMGPKAKYAKYEGSEKINSQNKNTSSFVGTFCLLQIAFAANTGTISHDSLKRQLDSKCFYEYFLLETVCVLTIVFFLL